jgi:hypothetical protein
MEMHFFLLCAPRATALKPLWCYSTPKAKKKRGAQMKNNLKFRVEAVGEDVVVTLDGTNCMVRYVKAETGLNLFHVRGDEKAPIHDIHFLARARQLANAKAKELGWILDDALLLASA